MADTGKNVKNIHDLLSMASFQYLHVMPDKAELDHNMCYSNEVTKDKG